MRIKKMKNPCHNCTERVLWCHSWCEKHAEYKENLEVIKIEEQKDKDLICYCANAKIRMNKEKVKRLKHE